ncbi:MAG TPA: methyltransferase domain-containing protein [Geminicoccus sp.]|uniref:class I SAM-dependent methyltransferase n=1 Tax=Geminicoccus sp. TaxID=2024832 RepID=UPI002C0F5357|nr:methyltransferase domain-containing protein [Geminicoccus sp.]HWL71012.1 methyltransferase domain-containing protein [Geminicoccus sp.]
MTELPRLFDRRAVHRNRIRALADREYQPFLLDEVADRLVERLSEIRRPFPRVLELGSWRGRMADLLRVAGLGRDVIVALDPVADALDAGPGLKVQAEPEALPFADESFDLVVSALALHHVDDLPGVLLQLRRILAPDGLMLLALLGGESLFELRSALMQAELDIKGGAAMRVAPFVDIRDAAALLQRAGLALPVADVDRITVSYPDALALLHELQSMGEGGALLERPRGLFRRDLLLRAAAIYGEQFARADGRVIASFDILHLSGWKPHESQQQPARRGSGQIRLAAAMGVPVEVLEGKAPPRDRDPDDQAG